MPEGALPRALLDPVREHVEKRQLRAAAFAPPERLKDIERLRDQGYLNAEEYERKRAEILKEL